MTTRTLLQRSLVALLLCGSGTLQAQGSGRLGTVPRAPRAEVAPEAVPVAPEEASTPVTTVESTAPATPATEAIPATGEPQPEQIQSKLLVFPTAAYGVDAVVGEHVSAEIRTTAARLGYQLSAPETARSVIERAGIAYPPTPADLWRAAFVAESGRAIYGRVFARDGFYVVELAVASLDGTGPFFAAGRSSSDGLHSLVSQLVERALPAATTWDGEGYQRYVVSPTPREDLTLDAPLVAPAPRRTPVDEGPGRRLQVGVQLAGAFGVSGDFANFLLGVEFGVRVTKGFLLGLTLDYANLSGRNARAQNLLPRVFAENRFRLSSRWDVTIPVRFSIGYLPFNGVVAGFSGGVNIPISSRLEVAAELLSPTFWFTPERTWASLNVAARLVYRL